ncbi:MAG: hypothetical protein RLZZ136_32 [Pseudomonadota bacterium]|jgi:DNA-binding transcriptional LysR family regulator
MDFRLLRYFIATVEEGSLQGASRRMNIAQPALSRRIRDLELTLDCALLMRGPRGVNVTAAGKAFYEEAVSLVKGLDLAIHNTRRLGLEQGRQVRIGLVQAARKYAFLQEATAAFSASRSLAELAYQRASSSELVEALREDRLDISLFYERRIRSPRLAERLIHHERYVLASHPAHALARHEPIALAELSGQSLIWLARQSEQGEQDILMQQCRLHGLDPEIGQLSKSHEEQLDLAAVSGGICLTPASTLLTVHPGQMVFRPITDFAMELDFTLGWNPDANNPAVVVMLDCMHAAIDNHQLGISNGVTAWSHLLGYPVVRLGKGGT